LKRLRLAEKLYSAHSKISGQIEVVQDGIERRLLVNGATQSYIRSDGSERGYWLGLIPDSEVRSALLLGLGGGTAARILRKKWPGVKIVAYELDPDVVRVAKSFFDLDPHTEVRTASAEEAFRRNEKFDLIVVDLYSGYEFSSVAESDSFISSARDHLTSGGLASFNRVNTYGGEMMRQFEAKLKRFFPEVWSKKVNQNLIFWGRI
jgi:spermidine synthase